VVRSRINSLMAEKKQRIVSIRCDSAAPECLARLRSMLGGNSLDLLFIDGDHSFEGVAADFNNYSPLVKNNGLILFHDIVPDFKTRFGIETASWTGGVPEFWSLLAGKFQCQTWIHDPEQDGYGLGLIHWQQCQKSQ
jgi:cephalosporin hydroxylase